MPKSLRGVNVTHQASFLWPMLVDASSLESSDVQSAAVEALYVTLHATRLFDGNLTECRAWIVALAGLPTSALALFERSLIALIRAPIDATSIVESVVAMADDVHRSPSKNIFENIDNDDVDNDNDDKMRDDNDDDAKQGVGSLCGDHYSRVCQRPFSPLLVVMLQACVCGKNDDTAVVSLRNLVADVVTLLFGSLLTVMPLVLLVARCYYDDLNSTLMSNIEKNNDDHENNDKKSKKKKRKRSSMSSSTTALIDINNPSQLIKQLLSLSVNDNVVINLAKTLIQMNRILKLEKFVYF